MNNPSFASCIEVCNECAVACDMCASACLNEHDIDKMRRCIAFDLDCAAICRTASSFMARNSEQAQQLCVVCAHICELCATECEMHDMDHCRECAKACRACADECLKMAGKPHMGQRMASEARANQ